MHILVITQYFWPENFRINDLTAELIDRGHRVTVLTGMPNYPEGRIYREYKNRPESFDEFHGAEVVRVWLAPRGRGGSARLFANYVSFAVSAALAAPFKLRSHRIDAIFVFQPSPITVGLPAVVMKWLKRAPISFWVLDLWPQSLTAARAIKSPILLGVVDAFVRFIYRHCDNILVQSNGFIPVVKSQLRDCGDRIVYFPSWAEDIAPSSSELFAPEISLEVDTFTIMFTGNIGDAQDFEAVLNAAEMLRDEDVRWVIVGDGRRAKWLETEIVRRNLTKQVLLPGRFPLERMPSFWRHADALLVSLRDELIFSLTIPGKLQSYLSTGVPILAMLNGEGARVVRESKAGLAVAAGDSAALAEAIRTMTKMPSAERAEMGSRGSRYSRAEFDRDSLVTRLEAILSNVQK